MLLVIIIFSEKILGRVLNLFGFVAKNITSVRQTYFGRTYAASP